MHSFRSIRHIIWLKISALHFVLFLLCACASVITAIIAFLHTDRELMTWSLIGIGASVFTGLVYRVAAANSKCPLCQNEPMLSKKCRKHRHAVMLLGSYRLTVASSALLLNHFRCPYCGESSRCRLRSHARED